jgi:hypothetical protein
MSMTSQSFVLAACLTAGMLIAGTAQRGNELAPPFAPNVTYTASGAFATPPISGTDTFRLAGQTFRITIVGNTATVPHSHGAGWADYTNLLLRGSVHTGLDPAPVNLGSHRAFLALAIGNPSYDLFQLQAPVIVIKQTVTISANIHMPTGAIKTWLIHAFNAPVTLSPANATITYTNGTDTTTLAIASGTLNATIPTGGG